MNLEIYFAFLQKKWNSVFIIELSKKVLNGDQDRKCL